MSVAVRDLHRYARSIGASVTLTRDGQRVRVRIEREDGLAVEALRDNAADAAREVERSMRAILTLQHAGATIAAAFDAKGRA